MFPSALWGDISHGTLQNLQQGLLHPFAGHVPSNRRILAFAGDLIHLVDVDDAPLRQLDVVVGRLDQTQQDVLHIVTHIARLSQCGGVSDGKWDLQHSSQCLGKQSLPAAGGTHEQNIALLKLHILRPAEVDAFIMVIHGHREGHFGLLLSNNILVQNSVYFLWGGDYIGDIAV